eukprot:TRINITY_DN5837_c0_g1_i3.p1 TRINITY_DN5837_c0_g1~~TRINITY_DN5837_c0_g1_i3.p1  ORF type:complete len:299 (+),score=77.86 TRINITY_DN5837_c0_g1_i3:72-968(+)
MSLTISLSPHLVELSSHELGNVVAQKMIRKCKDPIHFSTVFKQFEGKFVELCQTQYAKFPVDSLWRFPSKYSDRIMDEIKPHLKELSMHVNGQVCITSFIRKANEDQFVKLLKNLSPYLVELSVAGTPVIETLMSNCKEPTHYEIMSNEFKGKIYQMCKSKYSKSRVKQLVSDFPRKYTSFVVDEIIPHFKELATDENGHSALQSIIQIANEEQKMVMLEELSPSFSAISSHPLGNFSVGTLIDKCNSASQLQVIDGLMRNYGKQLEKGKHGKFVIGKYSSKPHRGFSGASSSESMQK